MHPRDTQSRGRRGQANGSFFDYSQAASGQGHPFRYVRGEDQHNGGQRGNSFRRHNPRGRGRGRVQPSNNGLDPNDALARTEGAHGRRSARDMYLAGTRAERALPAKRQIDETGVFRKRVRGGRIAKISKTREGENTCLFCEVCDKYLQDGNSKAAHDKGRDHRRKIEERREQEELEAREQLRQRDPVVGSVPKAINMDENSLMPIEQVKAMSKKMKQDELRPASFNAWCERSMKGVEKGRVLSVHREIIYEYSYHVDNGTLLTESWDRRKLASGKCFGSLNPRAYSDPTISEEELRKLYSEAPMTLDNPLPPAEDEITPIAPAPNSIPMQGRDYPAVVFVPGNSRDADQDVEMIYVVKAPPPPLVKIDVSWKLSKHAQALLRCNNIYPPEIAVDKFRSRHANIKIDKERRVGSRPLPSNLRTHVWRKQEELKKSFDDEDYDAKELEGDYMKLIAEIENYDNSSRLLRMCWSMVARINISCIKWAKVSAPLSQLMKLCKDGSGDADFKSEFAGHWIMSLLLKEESDENPDNYLDMRLSSMSRSFFKLEGTKYGLNVMRAILQNNYVSFMKYFKTSDFHHKTNNRSGYLLQALLPMMRQRAFLLWGSSSPSSNALVYKPRKYPLKSILQQLEYFDDGNPHGPRRWLSKEARLLIAGMGLHLEYRGDEDEAEEDGAHEYVDAICVYPRVTLESFINGKAIFGFHRPENCDCLKEDMVVG